MSDLALELKQLIIDCLDLEDLTPDDIDNAKRGSELIKRILSNLGTIATGIAELRNLYGTGHGSGPKSKGLEVRHARLVVTSSAALCEFLLSTYQSRFDTNSLWS